MRDDRSRTRNARDHVTSRLRLREWNSRLPGPYFITLCVHDRVSLFGTVSDSMMGRNPAGNMLVDVWSGIPSRYHNAALDAFVVMPNLVHCFVSLDADENGGVSRDAPSLSDIVRWFEIQSTMKYGDGVKLDTWPTYQGRLWQQGCMDHIIRTESALERLRTYIEANPATWEDDTFHPDAKTPAM